MTMNKKFVRLSVLSAFLSCAACSPVPDQGVSAPRDPFEGMALPERVVKKAMWRQVDPAEIALLDKADFLNVMQTPNAYLIARIQPAVILERLEAVSSSEKTTILESRFSNVAQELVRKSPDQLIRLVESLEIPDLTRFLTNIVALEEFVVRGRGQHVIQWVEDVIHAPNGAIAFFHMPFSALSRQLPDEWNRVEKLMEGLSAEQRGTFFENPARRAVFGLPPACVPKNSEPFRHQHPVQIPRCPG